MWRGDEDSDWGDCCHAVTRSVDSEVFMNNDKEKKGIFGLGGIFIDADLVDLFIFTLLFGFIYNHW